MLGFASRLEALVRRVLAAPPRNTRMLWRAEELECSSGCFTIAPDPGPPKGGGWAAGAPARAQPPAGAFPTSMSISQWRHTAQPPCS